MNANPACLPPGARLRLFAAVLASCAPIVCSQAPQKLEDVVLPKAETWMAQCKDAFAFRHAPQREDVAWFVARVREDRYESKPGQYLLAWSERGGGEVHSVDLGDDLCNEQWFVGPVWNHQADRIAVAIAAKDGGTSKTKVVVIDTKTATATTWIENVSQASLSWAGDGRTLAVADGQSVHVMKGPADEATASRSRPNAAGAPQRRSRPTARACSRSASPACSCSRAATNRNASATRCATRRSSRRRSGRPTRRRPSPSRAVR